MPMSNMSDRQLEKHLPAQPWRDPIMAPTSRGMELVCRYCLARSGLHGGDTERSFSTSEAFRAHMSKEHPQ